MEVAVSFLLYPRTSENTGSQIFYSCGKQLAGDSLRSSSKFMENKIQVNQVNSHYAFFNIY